MKKTQSRYVAIAVLTFTAMLCLCFTGVRREDTTVAQEEKPTIVLVHGAFADGSSWNKVIPILQKKGYHTIAVQNPLTSLDDDVAFVNRVLAEVKGPIVLVGHSWGGVVITQAGNNEKIKSLVYVAAYAPDEGQSIDWINKDAAARKVPEMRGLMDPVIVDGFIHLKEDVVVKHFAQDLPEEEAKLVAAVQGRFHVSTLTGKVSNPAWKNKPSFYVVSDHDHIISPQIEAEMAKNIKATVFHLPTSHVAMLAKPKEVADVIIKAAGVK